MLPPSQTFEGSEGEIKETFTGRVVIIDATAATPTATTASFCNKEFCESGSWLNSKRRWNVSARRFDVEIDVDRSNVLTSKTVTSGDIFVVVYSDRNAKSMERVGPLWSFITLHKNNRDVPVYSVNKALGQVGDVESPEESRTKSYTLTMAWDTVYVNPKGGNITEMMTELEKQFTLNQFPFCFVEARKKKEKSRNIWETIKNVVKGRSRSGAHPEVVRYESSAYIVLNSVDCSFK